MLGVSPVAMAANCSPLPMSPTTVGPLCTPMRKPTSTPRSARQRAASGCMRATMSSAACTARQASSSWTLG